MGAIAKDGVYLIKQQHFDNYEKGLRALNSQCKVLKTRVHGSFRNHHRLLNQYASGNENT